MTVDKLRYAPHLMADRSRSIPDICRELDDMPSSTLYHYLHADSRLKDPGVVFSKRMPTTKDARPDSRSDKERARMPTPTYAFRSSQATEASRRRPRTSC